MLPLCADQGVGVIPWSPLGRGRLTRPWDSETMRSRTDEFGTNLYARTLDADRKVVEAVRRVSEARGSPMAQVALAWMLAKPEVSAPIIGASKLSHVDDAVAALSISLSPEERAALEAEYIPHPVAGFG